MPISSPAASAPPFPSRRTLFPVLPLLLLLLLLLLVSSPAVDQARGSDAPSNTPSPGKSVAARSTLDPRIREYIMPARVVWTTPDGEAKVENPASLLESKTGQVTLDAHNPCVLRSGAGEAKPGLLLDFGRELSGGVQIMVWHTQGNKPVRLRVRFGESVSEAMSEVWGEKNPTNDHAVRDQSCLVPWLGTHEIGNTGFRFVRIDLLDTNSFVQLKLVRAVYLHRDIPYKGSFKCSDERLNRIWDTGAYTVLLNMQDYLWDGIKRDRLVWIGDMHPETMTIRSVFGPEPIVTRSLDLVRAETPLPKWMNGISAYSMWWILIQRDWYNYTGDLDYLRAQKPYLTGLLAELAKQVDARGVEALPEMRFLDWPSSANKPAIHAGLQSLLSLTMQAGQEISQTLGDAKTAGLCRETRSRLAGHKPDPAGSKQAAALMALAGLADPAAMNRDVLAVGGASQMSTFYGYYVLQARALAGDYQGCLDVIRTYWGAMLDVGATTFWEDFDMEWLRNAGRIDELVPAGKKDIHGDYGNYCYQGFRHSLCHGWASGPTAWLSEHVLGVSIAAPGCKVLRVQPHLGDLDWAEGTFPTPMGSVFVRHEKGKDGRVKSTIKAPKGVRIVRE